MENTSKSFAEFHNESEKFNHEFDLWKRLAAMVISDMSSACGWKGLHRDMNFSLFSGYSMEHSDTEVLLWYNDECIEKITPSSDGVIIDGPYTLGECGQLCLSEENLHLAKREMNNGNEVIAGITYNGLTVVGLDSDHRDERAQISSLFNNIRFCPEEKLHEAYEDFTKNKLSAGPEPQMPEITLFFYDGRTIRSEHTFDPINNRSIDKIAIDQALMQGLREQIMEVRNTLDELVGVSSEDRPFMYKDCIYPTCYMHKDTVFLCFNHGKDFCGLLTIRNGKIGLYDDYAFNKPLAEPKMAYSSIKDAVTHVRQTVLNKANVNIAKSEYASYIQDKKKDQNKGRKL